MHAPSSIPSLGSPFAVAIGRRTLARCVALLLIACPHPGLAQAQPDPHHPGHWTGLEEWGEKAVHMVLLPGSGGSSKILWWNSGSGYNPQYLAGKVAGWTWNAGADSCGSFGSFTQTPLYAAPYNIFCSGHTHLADGRALLSGGTASGEIGSRKSVYFDPTQGNPWTLLEEDEMTSRRWYPTAQLLPDGRALLSSGSQYHHMIAWGGTSTPGSSTAAQGDLQRLQLTDESAWDSAIPFNAPSWPSKRYGHSMPAVDQYAHAIVGGRKWDGEYLMDVWGLKIDGNPTQSGFGYSWQQHHAVAPLPDGRMEHSAFFLNDGSLIIYGGRCDTVFDDVWRRYESGGQRIWEKPPQEPAEALPGKRFGQTLAYQYSTTYPVRNRALVFGGASTTAGVLADSNVWELTIEINTPLQNKAKWRKLVESGSSAPMARYQHAMTPDPYLRERGTGPDVSRFFVSGGRGSFGPDTLSNESWELWDTDVVASSDTVAWAPLPDIGTTGRAGHSMIYDPSVHRLVVMGGDTGGATSDNSVWETSIAQIGWVDVTPAMGPAFAGHSAFFHDGRNFARNPERLTPGPSWYGTWDDPVAAPLLQEYYPFQFTIANGPHAGKIFNAGAGDTTFLLDLNTPSWTKWPAAGSGFRGGSAVLYRPDRVMKCGSRDTEGGSTPPSAVGTTKFIALDQPSPSWTTSDTMDYGRVNHNLTILPSGEVLASGGTELITDASIGGRPRRQVELWRPPDATYPNGVWYGGSSLDSSTAVRDYHSTALLLPDGRVLTAGGEHSLDKTTAQIYCPPYLFTSGGGPATRPVITSSPATVTYGQPFAIVTPNAGTIASACLIRPGAVTHGYDQDQRFIPLSIAALGDNSGLLALAPTSGRVAPPGDYLLFILNQSGVPAVAKWIRLGQCPTIPCDTDSPPKVTGLYADIVGPNEIWLVWNAPGDDTSPLTGEYDLRYSAGVLASDQEYDEAELVSGEPAVASAGTPRSYTVSGLFPCTEFQFALKTRDGTGSFKNWSLLSNTLTASTFCSGGGGEFSAERVDGAGEGGGSSPAAVAPSDNAIAAASALDAGAGMLVAETRQMPEGGWQVTLGRLAQIEGVEGADAGAIVSQVPDGAGGWKTLGRYQPSPGQSPLGLCALRHQGRMVFPSGYALDRVVSGIKAGDQDLSLSLANHSRLGSLSGGLADEGGAVAMELGDALTLEYAPGGAAVPGAANSYLLIRRDGSSESSATPARSALASKVPTRFALHQNQPNPFRRTTTIAFDLPVVSPVRLEVFDLLGRRVATLADGEHPAGAHAVEYDLRNVGGTSLRAGVYVYRLRAGTFEEQRKLTVLP